jgi:hypothetical protein
MIGIITMLFYSIPSLSSSIANWDDELDWIFVARDERRKGAGPRRGYRVGVTGQARENADIFSCLLDHLRALREASRRDCALCGSFNTNCVSPFCMILNFREACFVGLCPPRNDMPFAILSGSIFLKCGWSQIT